MRTFLRVITRLLMLVLVGFGLFFVYQQMTGSQSGASKPVTSMTTSSQPSGSERTQGQHLVTQDPSSVAYKNMDINNLFAQMTPIQFRDSVKSWLVFDVDTRQVIASNNEYMQVEPASLTKLMTAYLVFNALEQHQITLEQVVYTNYEARHREGSRTFLEENKPVTVDTLIKGMLVQSGNDATLMLAYTVGGTVDSFVHQMNETAANLGMTQTHFANPDGLPNEQHYTTAHDLMLLTQSLLTKFPQYQHYFSMMEFTHNKITQKNRNGLLGKQGVDGLKTGHTQSAGYCLISTAKRQERRLAAVVVGAEGKKQRERVSANLLNWAFQNTLQKTLFSQNQPVVNVRVWEGDQQALGLVVSSEVRIAVPRQYVAQVKYMTRIDKHIVAPVRQGDVLGSLDVLVDNQIVRRYPLQAMNTVGEGAFFSRMWDKVLSTFE